MPSRGRPKKSLETYHKWQSQSTNQFILSLDHDDPTVNEYLDLYPDYFKLKPVPPGEGSFGRCFSDNHAIIVNKNRSCVDAINVAAGVSIGDIFIVVSDDTGTCDSWPDKIYTEVYGKSDWLLKTDDGIQDYIVTMTIMDRTYYERDGFIYHPDYFHQFADTWLTVLADIRGRLIKSPLKFPHLHPGAKGDELNKRNDLTWRDGLATFKKHLLALPPGDLKKISDKGMIDFIRNYCKIPI